MAKTRIQVDEIAANNGGKTEFENTATYKTLPILALMGPNDFVAKSHLAGGSGNGVQLPLDTTEPSLYTLNGTELGAVNALGRQPNFSAVTSSGQGNWSDIYPIYTPYNAYGAYTQIQVVLHDDGSGLNAEDTLVQFS